MKFYYQSLLLNIPIKEIIISDNWPLNSTTMIIIKFIFIYQYNIYFWNFYKSVDVQPPPLPPPPTHTPSQKYISYGIEAFLSRNWTNSIWLSHGNHSISPGMLRRCRRIGRWRSFNCYSKASCWLYVVYYSSTIDQLPIIYRLYYQYIFFLKVFTIF